MSMLNGYRLQIKCNLNIPNHDKTAPQDGLSPERLILEALSLSTTYFICRYWMYPLKQSTLISLTG
ncbi:hypothetical protein [Paenibacillus sp. EZ-K15]|uniref:hypothetical protein n=1 Tax=Paenibacillus sp. EZ-K15 TaxID=2044275 RepID=UPI001F16B4F1|nr:hypothetical protein [Paenibacillus sp. EZ-K15]